MTTRDRAWAIILGTGMAILPIHNTWLTKLTTDGNGNSVVFLPAIGTLLMAVAALFYVLQNWPRVRAAGLGDRHIAIPMLVIVAAMGLSGFVNGGTAGEKAAPLFMGITLFAVYLASRQLGSLVFRPLIPIAVANALVIIGLGLANPGMYTGGLISNYLASAGYLILAVLLNPGRWQQPFLLLVAIALFFVGALEAVFILGVLAVAVLWRRDVGGVMLTGIFIVGVLALLWMDWGWMRPLYNHNYNITIMRDIATGTAPLDSQSTDALTSGRWHVIVNSVHNVSFFGHGYSLSTVGGGIVHNVPLIILWQIGPVAALAWLWASARGLWTSRMKYAWIAVLAASVPDHYIWTQLTPLWWALAGAGALAAEPDLIFARREKATVEATA